MRPVTAIAIPLLVLAGVASALNLSGDQSGGGDRVVAASGHGPGVGFVADPAAAPIVPLTPPVAVDSLPVPPPPPATVSSAPSTTASTTTTVATTLPTTVTSVASSGPATVTIVNEYTAAVRLTVNGTSYDLAAGQQKAGISIMPAPSGNDTIGLARADTPSCGMGDAEGLFKAGRSYRLTVVVSRGTCGPAGPPGPAYTVAST